MGAVLAPFHQDERLPDDSIRLPHALGVEVVDPVLPRTGQWARLAELYGQVADAVAAHVRSGACPTVVSGDCLTALGALAGIQRAGVDPAVVWLDAHGDLHTLASSTSGYLGGTALRMALGADTDKLTGPLGARPVAEDRAVLVDARDLDPPEADFLAASRVRHLHVGDVTAGLHPDTPLLVHLDLDVIDPRELPGLRFPAPDGPDSDDVITAVRTLTDTGRVAALDIACPWHPPTHPHHGHTRTDLLARLLTG